MVLKKVPGTVPSGKPPKSEPYRAVPCSGKAPLVYMLLFYDSLNECSSSSSVAVAGSSPVITVDGFDHSGGLRLQCESEGWYPEPDLEWLNSEGVSLSSETTETHRNTDGFRVKHTVTVYERDSKIHCRVKLRNHMLDTQIITSSMH